MGAVTKFGALLGNVREVVETELGTWLAPKVISARAVSAEVGAAAESIERLALRGGKRMRAGLVAAAHEAAGGDWRQATHAMLAMELLQVYLLVHDDWMDDDAVRRGGPAVHVALREALGDLRMGDAAAVLAGDLASGYAQEVMTESALPADRVLRAVRAFAEIQEEVVVGQLSEMRARPNGTLGKTKAVGVEQVHALKTASYTTKGPVKLGAILAGASQEAVAAFERFGRPIGVALQLRDDLLGVFGDPSATGKPVWNDLRQGKRTALVEELENEPKIASVLGRLDATDAELEDVVRFMESSGARARVEARVKSLCEEARTALGSFAMPGGTETLESAIQALGERSV